MPDTPTPTVLREMPRDRILLLRLNRMEKRNALSNAMLHDLADAVREAERQGTCRCIILAGDPAVFSAGADIREMEADGIDAIQNRTRAAEAGRSWRRRASR